MSPEVDYITQAVAPPTRRLRRTCWRVLLGLDPMISPICRLVVYVRQAGPDQGGCLAAMEALVQASENLQRIRHPFYRRTLEVAREHVSAALAELDVDDTLLDCVVGELVSGQAGLRGGGDACVALARLDPPLRTAYASAVQATYQALWISKQSGESRGSLDSLRSLP